MSARSGMNGAINEMQSPLVYLDTNVFLAAFESPATHAKPAQELLATLKDVKGAAVTSGLTLAELLAPMAREGALPPMRRRKLYYDLLLRSGVVEVLPLSPAILQETADFCQVSQLKLPDAIHAVTASQAGCRFFMSHHDDGLGPLPGEMRRLQLDSAGLGSVMEALRS
jgi:predicted nucleic acid-binding protein